MNTILVWVLISVGGYNGNDVVYSPQMVDLESCERLQKSVSATARPDRYTRTSCVQIKVVK